MMDDTKAPAPKPDMIEQAGELIRRFGKGEAISGTLYHDRNAAIVLVSSILAVAGELRDIHNVLHEINQHASALLALAQGDDLGGVRMAEGINNPDDGGSWGEYQHIKATTFPEEVSW